MVGQPKDPYLRTHVNRDLKEMREQVIHMSGEKHSTEGVVHAKHMM